MANMSIMTERENSYYSRPKALYLPVGGRGSLLQVSRLLLWLLLI